MKILCEQVGGFSSRADDNSLPLTIYCLAFDSALLADFLFAPLAVVINSLTKPYMNNNMDLTLDSSVLPDVGTYI